MLRSSKQLRAEIDLLEEIERSAKSSPRLDEWDTYAVPKYRQRLIQAREELANLGDELEWVFRGVGVYTHSIAMKRLNALAQPLGRTLHWTARDLLFVEGRPDSSVPLDRLVEPVVTGTIQGSSFGLRIAGPPTIEQMSFAGSLFDRTAERVVKIFDAPNAASPETEIVEVVAGLRENTINALVELTRELARAGKPSQIRWRGETVVPVSTDAAALLNETLSEVTPFEETIEVRGELIGADADTGQFHIVVPDTPQQLEYRGKAAEGVKETLRGIPIAALVVASLRVIQEESQFLATPRETYVLESIRPVGRGLR